MIFMIILAGVVLISRLNKTYKCLVLAIASFFLFSCTKSVITPNNNKPPSKTMFRVKQVNMDNQVSYSEIVIVELTIYFLSVIILYSVMMLLPKLKSSENSELPDCSPDDFS